MGSLPRLKKKEEHRYREGSINESRNCRYCTQFVPNYVIQGKGNEPRCQIMGLRESIRYRVRPDFTCDVQVFNGTDFSKVCKSQD